MPAEGKWSEVNQRVIYPIKDVLVRMETNLMISDPAVQFCLSFITVDVAENRLRRVQESWNLHLIEG